MCVGVCFVCVCVFVGCSSVCVDTCGSLVWFWVWISYVSCCVLGYVGLAQVTVTEK